MSKYNGLNYASAFLKALNCFDFSPLLTAEQKETFKYLIQASTVFELPPEGCPVGKTELEGLIGEDLTLPFPFICLEFQRNTTENDRIPANQIVLAMELEPEDTLIDDPNIDHKIRNCWKAGSSVILVRTLAHICTADANQVFLKGWMVSPYQGIIICSAAYRNEVFKAKENQFLTWLVPVFGKTMDTLEKIHPNKVVIILNTY